MAALDAPLCEHPRADSLCVTVFESGEAAICEDVSADPRFSYSSFTQGDEPLRFYVSLPLQRADGHVLGTLCLWSTATRATTPETIALLRTLAVQATNRLEVVRLVEVLGLDTSSPASG